MAFWIALFFTIAVVFGIALFDYDTRITALEQQLTPPEAMK